MGSYKVPLNIFNPAPEQLNSVILFQLKKSTEILFFLIVSHALRNKQALLIPLPVGRCPLIEYSIVDQLINLLWLSFSH
jgi:hypothetical protein